MGMDNYRFHALPHIWQVKYIPPGYMSMGHIEGRATSEIHLYCIYSQPKEC